MSHLTPVVQRSRFQAAPTRLEFCQNGLLHGASNCSTPDFENHVNCSENAV